jgi:hypothetical protein
MNRKGELFVIRFTKKRVFFEREDEIVSTDDVKTVKRFLIEAFIEKQLFHIGDL